MDLMLYLYLFLLFIFTLIALRYLYLVISFFNHRKSWHLEVPKLRRFPKVCVQLPVFNEPFVVERIIRACSELEWPKDKLEIQVLDDSTDETPEIVRRVIEELKPKGLNIKHVRRGSRKGFKAGALSYGMDLSDADYFVIFDADFIPRKDFLLKTIPFLEDDPKLGAVQTRWDFINGEDNIFAKAQKFMLNVHFVLEQFVRSREGLWMTFNGTAGVLKRSAIEWAGGWETDTLTEDADLSFRLYKKGYKILYLPNISTPSELPNSPLAFKSQQRRWAKGGVQVFKKYWKDLFKNEIPLGWKIEFLFQTVGNLGYPLGILLLILLPAILHLKFSGYKPEIFLFMGIIAVFDLLMVWSTFAIANFYISKDVKDILFTPLCMAIVSSLGINNTVAVIEGFIGDTGVFERTPKAGDRGIVVNKDISRRIYLSKLEIIWGAYLIVIAIVSVFINQLILGVAVSTTALGLLWLGTSSYFQSVGYEVPDMIFYEQTHT